MSMKKLEVGYLVQIFGCTSHYKVVSVDVENNRCDIIGYLGKVLHGQDMNLVNTVKTSYRPSFIDKLNTIYETYMSKF